MILFTKFEEL